MDLVVGKEAITNFLFEDDNGKYRVVGCDYLYLPKAGFSSHSRIVQT